MRFPVTRTATTDLPQGAKVMPSTSGGYKGVLTVNGRSIEVGPYTTTNVVCSALRQEARRHGLR